MLMYLAGLWMGTFVTLLGVGLSLHWPNVTMTPIIVLAMVVSIFNGFVCNKYFRT